MTLLRKKEAEQLVKNPAALQGFQRRAVPFSLLSLKTRMRLSCW
jgi:hypothetical protein